MNLEMFELVNNEEILLEERDYLQFRIIYDGIGGDLRYYPERDEFELVTYITQISDYELDEEEHRELRQLIDEYCYDEVGIGVNNLYEYFINCLV